MKQAVMTAPGSIVLQDSPDPQPAPDQVLVQVRAVGICTWEQKFYQGVPDSYPFIGGHEICGDVVAVGSEVAQKLSPGDRVVVASLTRCGECYYCRRGLDNQCLSASDAATPGKAWGPGGFSELFLARGYEVYHIAATTDPAVGTLAEPMACVLRSIDKGQVAIGDTVVVLGAGVMGVLHILLARQRGARVLVSETDPGRRQRALEFGAAAAFDPLSSKLPEMVRGLTDGRGAETVFFTAGGKAAILDGLAALAKNGTLVVYGATKAADCFELDPRLFHYDEICLTGVTKHTKDTFRRSSELISAGILPLDKLVSRRFAFTEIAAAFAQAGSLADYRTVLEVVSH